MGAVRFLPIFLLLSFPSVATTPDKFVIAINEAYEEHLGREAMQTLFTDIYAPLGITPQLEFYPSLRALELANNGTLDADAGRSENVGQAYANLIRVPFPIITVPNAYFCLSIEACNISSNSRYGLVSGFEEGKKYCEDNNLHCLDNASFPVLVNAFIGGSFDVLIGSLSSVTPVLCKLKNRQVYYRPVKELTITRYHYIHKKHQALEPQLALSIQRAAEKGLMQQLFNQASVLLRTCPLNIIKLEQ